MLREQVRPRTSKVRSCYVFTAQVYGGDLRRAAVHEQHSARGTCRAMCGSPARRAGPEPRCPPARQAQEQGPSHRRRGQTRLQCQAGTQTHFRFSVRGGQGHLGIRQLRGYRQVF